jgi:uncharacterized protein (UPF0297 family)
MYLRGEIMSKTVRFTVEKDRSVEIKEILTEVYSALENKGYNPINQMVGYLISGDPTYITSQGNARTMIRRVERDEILEELLKSFLENE